MKKLSYLLIAAAAWTFQACGDAESDPIEAAQEANEEKGTLDSSLNDSGLFGRSDADFMVMSAGAGMLEVEAGKLGEQKATNPQVKEFASMMAKDHSSANEELKALAAQKNITLPAAIGEDHQKDLNDLREKSAEDFDKDYMKMMVDQHEDDVNRFEKWANDAEDADIKAFAAKTLPTLRAHLEKARTIRDGLK